MVIICFYVCIHIDNRKDMSCAYENGKTFMANGTAHSLLSVASQYYGDRNTVDVAVAALTACKQLITSEESVSIMSKHGAMTLPKAIFTCYLNELDDNGHSSDENLRIITLPLLRAVTGVMRNLCAGMWYVCSLVHKLP